MNARDEAALALWQAERETIPMSTDARDRMDARLREYFGPTSNEYEEIQCQVTEIFSAKPIFTSDLPLHLSEAL